MGEANITEVVIHVPSQDLFAILPLSVFVGTEIENLNHL